MAVKKKKAAKKVAKKAKQARCTESEEDRRKEGAA